MTTGDVCILACDSSFFVLRYNSEMVQKWSTQGIETDEQGTIMILLSAY